MITDPFTREIIRSYLVSTVHEMVKTTARAASSVTFSEGLDFSCAVFDAHGRMIAQAAGSGTHLGGARPTMLKILDTYRTFDEGDVVLTNDPYTSTHQPDVVVVRPIYYQGQHLGFAANIGHWNDIGGMTAGGCAGTSTHVIQDGLIIPICKLYRRQELVREIRDFILNNVRYPDEAWGDLQSQIAACRTAEERIGRLVERYGAEVIIDAMQLAITYSRDRFLARMPVIPDGVYTAEDFIEDDGISDRPYLLKVRIEKNAKGFLVDFSGSSRQAPTPINSNYSITCAAVYSGLIAITDPSIPVNEGVFGLFDVRVPKGTIVNAQWPASVIGSTYEVSKRVGELMFKALGDDVPSAVAAGGYSSGNNMSARCVSEDGERETMWYYYLEGGQGARLGNDGNSAVYHWHQSAANQPVEIWEHRLPVIFLKYALIPDSGGAGKKRGGLGTVRHIKCLWDHYVSGLADRQRIPPWGLAGGAEGRPNRWAIVQDGVERTFKEAYGLVSNSKFYNLKVAAGTVIVLETGGGGGFGDPRLRDPAEVLVDVREGYVSPQSARERYGVDMGELGKEARVLVT